MFGCLLNNSPKYHIYFFLTMHAIGIIHFELDNVSSQNLTYKYDSNDTNYAQDVIHFRFISLVLRTFGNGIHIIFCTM